MPDIKLLICRDNQTVCARDKSLSVNIFALVRERELKYMNNVVTRTAKCHCVYVFMSIDIMCELTRSTILRSHFDGRRNKL